jgi:CheY-like chemotaxis protein
MADRPKNAPAAIAPVAEGSHSRAARYIAAGTTLYEAVGCRECAETGYRGRFSIMEVLTVNSDIEHRIGQGATADQIADAGRRSGMRSLWESGLRHVLAGESTMDELLRVTDVPMEGKMPPAAPPARESRGAGGAATPPPPASALPAAPPPAPPAFPSLDFMDMELVDPPGGTADGAVARGQGTKVLLVEDEEQLRRVMKDLLEREGYVVSEARDGVQALDQVDRHAPDIIVLDLNLPGLDGYSVLQQLRSRAATRTIPVMVLTAKGDEDNEVRVFELGADDFITKPFRARALSARLEAVLGRRRA